MITGGCSQRVASLQDQFSAPGASRVFFEYYGQAFGDLGVKQMKTWTANKLPMPVVTLSGEGSMGPNMLPSIQILASNVRGIDLMGCGHFLPEECPDDYAKAVMGFSRQVPIAR
jgi:pimeloyl-ACP methyl ester carboxylesterase